MELRILKMGLLIFKYMHLYIYILFNKMYMFNYKTFTSFNPAYPFLPHVAMETFPPKVSFFTADPWSTIASTTLLWYFSYSDRRKENSSHQEMITRCHAQYAQQSIHIFIHILNVRIDFWKLFCCVDLHDTPQQLFMTAYQRKITLKT